MGYFVIDSVWPTFYYTPVTQGKNVWLGLQLACMALYSVGVLIAFMDIRRVSHTLS